MILCLDFIRIIRIAYVHTELYQHTYQFVCLVHMNFVSDHIYLIDIQVYFVCYPWWWYPCHGNSCFLTFKCMFYNHVCTPVKINLLLDFIFFVIF